MSFALWSIRPRRRRTALLAALTLALTAFASFGRMQRAQALVAPEYGRWTIVASPATAAETNSGTHTVNFVIATSVTTNVPCGLAINLGGTATLATDYDYAYPVAGTAVQPIGTTGDLGAVTAYTNVAATRSYWLRMPAGTASFTIPITVNGDTSVETDETVSVSIASSALTDGNLTLGCGYNAADGVAGLWLGTHTITNDDAAVAPEYGRWTITATPPSAPETNSGTHTVNVTVANIGAATNRPCGLAINLAGTATLGTDYDYPYPIPGSTVQPIGTTGDINALTAYTNVAATRSYWVRIPAGMTSFTIPVTVNGDTAVELDETFSISIASSVLTDGAATLGCGYNAVDGAAGLWLATHTITNDDVAAYGRWTISSPVSVVEGNSGTTTVNYVISTATPTNVPCGLAINVVAPTTALLNNDYTYPVPPNGSPAVAIGTTGDINVVTTYLNGAPGTVSYWLRMPAGLTSFTIPIIVNGDLVNEADEPVSIAIASNNLLDGAGTLGCGYNAADAARWVATTTIINDDAPPLYSIVGPAPTIEGNAGTTTDMTFTVSSPTTPELPCQILVTALSATATWPYDWQFPLGTYTFTQVVDVTSSTFSFTKPVTIIGDNLFEGDETFTVSIAGTGANPCPVDLTKNVALGTILNDDFPPATTTTTTTTTTITTTTTVPKSAAGSASAAAVVTPAPVPVSPTAATATPAAATTPAATSPVTTAAPTTTPTSTASAGATAGSATSTTTTTTTTIKSGSGAVAGASATTSIAPSASAAPATPVAGAPSFTG